MTVADSIALVAGVALAFALVWMPEDGPPIGFSTPGLMVISKVIVIFVGITAALSLVVLMRVITYQRMPQSVEWLAILIPTTFITSRPSISDLVIRISSSIDDYVSPRFFPATPEGYLWVAGFLCSFAILGGLLMLRWTRNRLAPWLKTLGLMGLAMLAESGPFRFLRELGANLISPSDGFGPGDLAVLHRGLCILIAHIPIGLFYAIPAMGVVGERIRGVRWTWTEWASLSGSSMVGVSMLMLYRGEFSQFSLAWLAERGMVFAWLLVVALLGRLIVIHLAPAWNGWIGNTSGQDRSSDSLARTL
jgi:hypothetical protein